MLSQTILEHKYAHTKSDGTKETWEEVVNRVVDAVARPLLPHDADDMRDIILKKKFIPAGRYLYASGRPNHQVNNCLLLDVEDSREGWADLLNKVTNGLMTGAGVGVVYSKIRPEGAPVKGLGGHSTGPIALMNIVNEAGRHIRQGGSRRSAIWAGLSWKHDDINKFIRLKDWSDDIKYLKEKDFNFPAPLDSTNISVILDDDFFDAFEDPGHRDHTKAKDVYWSVVRNMCETGEPGFAVNVGDNAGDVLRNAPLSGDTYVLTKEGYRRILDTLGQDVELWTGKRWAKTRFKKTKENAELVEIIMTGDRRIKADLDHEFLVKCDENIFPIKAKYLTQGTELHYSLPTSEYKFSAYYYTLGFMSEDTGKHMMVDIEECAKHFDGEAVKDMALGRVDLDSIPEEYVPSFIGGAFDASGYILSRSVAIRPKNRDFLRRQMDRVGIVASIASGHMYVMYSYVDRFYNIVPTFRLKVTPHPTVLVSKIRVLAVNRDLEPEDVYCCDVGYEEHSFTAEGVLVSNCTEVHSADDSDICNLGSLNFGVIETIDELKDVVYLATAFLLCGSIYSLVPYPKVAQVRERNRRIGLGIMGMHEWLLKRGYKYGPNEELSEWLSEYEYVSEDAADEVSNQLSIARPLGVRAIAPAGTISILAETTSGIEPVFCVAMKRRYMKGNDWYSQYIIDYAADRLIRKGINPYEIEDAYSLAFDVERRIAFQAYVQSFVDMCISSTINLPRWGSSNDELFVDKFGKILVKYLPRLRGITTYPDGARGGQPLVPVSYKEAISKVGVEFVENESCKSGICGI